MPMFAAVKLKCSEQMVVMTSWCLGLKCGRVKMQGNRPNLERTIFVSPNEADFPDFSLPIQREFNSSKRACYRGCVLKILGKHFF